MDIIKRFFVHSDYKLLTIDIALCYFDQTPLTALSSINQRLGHLFGKARQGRHILIKFHPILYLARKQVLTKIWNSQNGIHWNLNPILRNVELPKI